VDLRATMQIGRWVIIAGKRWNRIKEDREHVIRMVWRQNCLVIMCGKYEKQKSPGRYQLLTWKPG
jgi:hypothetical protein